MHYIIFWQVYLCVTEGNDFPYFLFILGWKMSPSLFGFFMKQLILQIPPPFHRTDCTTLDEEVFSAVLMCRKDFFFVQRCDPMLVLSAMII